MAPVEGEIYCTQEKGVVKEITIKNGEIRTLNNFPGVNLSVMCNPKDSAGLALLTGQTELVRVLMFDSKIKDDEGRDLDPDSSIKFAGSKYLILSYAHSTDEIKLEHCQNDNDCLHIKTSSDKSARQPLFSNFARIG